MLKNEIQLSLKPPKVYNDILQLCSGIDTTALHLLENNYKEGGNGIILNTDEDLNLQLQVSVFIGALNDALKSRLTVLILCPDDLILNWHYYISWCGVFKITVVTTKNHLNKIHSRLSNAVIIGFSHINLIKEYNGTFGSVIIDSFDEVALRVLIRNLPGKCYNIGITYRDFFEHPDQKLQWKMVSWLGPAGRQSNFNVKKYKHIWIYVALKSQFLRPSIREKERFWSILKQWSKEHNLYHLLSKYKQKPVCMISKVKNTIDIVIDNVVNEAYNHFDTVEEYDWEPKNVNNCQENNEIKDHNTKVKNTIDTAIEIVVNEAYNNFDAVEEYNREPTNINNYQEIIGFNKTIKDHETNVGSTIDNVVDEADLPDACFDTVETYFDKSKHVSNCQENTDLNEIIEDHETKSENSVENTIDIDEAYNHFDALEEYNWKPKNVNNCQKSIDLNETIKYHETKVESTIDYVVDEADLPDACFDTVEKYSDESNHVSKCQENTDFHDTIKDHETSVENTVVLDNVVDKADSLFTNITKPYEANSESIDQFMSEFSHVTDLKTNNNVSYKDILISEQRILDNNAPTESDLFLKSLCCNVSNKVSNSSTTIVSNVTLDVDNLIAEVMELVQK